MALRLGLTSFGGPIAHLGYFRREYVERRGWLDEPTYADFVALSQLLPGPASSQVGILIGTRRAGMIGGVAAWLGFTLPSAIALVLFGLLARQARRVVGRLGRGPQDRRGRDRRPGRLPDGPGADPGLAAPSRRGPRGRRRPDLDDAVRPGRHHRRRCADRPDAVVRAGGGTDRPGTESGLASGRDRVSRRPSPCCCSACRCWWRSAASRWPCSRPSIGAARSCSAAATSCCRCSTRRSSTRAGSPTTSSSPDTGPRRPCPDRCSASRRISGRSRARHRTAGPERRSPWSRSSCRRSC